MSLNIEKLANYLGKKAAGLLGDLPFKGWTFERTVETGLDKPLVDYVSAENGMEFTCDGEDNVNNIFIFYSESRRFREDLQDLPAASGRQEVIARLGPPSKSGEKITDPILGEYGAWDRFKRPDYTVHVEYHVDIDSIKMLTLMRADVVP